MEWINQTLTWYFYLLVIGLAFLPLSAFVFRRFFDRGYPFAKTIGILALSYLSLVLGIVRILPFTQLSIFFLMAVSFISGMLLLKRKGMLTHLREIFGKRTIAFIVFEELLFLGALFFLSWMRGQEPSVHSLEKFMDFGFINSILRSKFFPPPDMWYSANSANPNGFPINYYYFGHLSGALLIKISSTMPAVGYNLILATIFAQGITLGFSLCANIVYMMQKLLLKNKETDYRRVIITGILGSFLINLAGNLHTIYAFTTGYQPPDKPVPFWRILSGYNPTAYWYPNATRFIPYTIHEFPSYSYVVADLHGHVFDIPFVLLTLALFVLFFASLKNLGAVSMDEDQKPNSKSKTKKTFSTVLTDLTNFRLTRNRILAFPHLPATNHQLLYPAIFGFMAAVHYMTNAFDGPIYILLALLTFSLVYIFDMRWLASILILFVSFYVFALPFSLHFSPFVSGIGVNCAPQFLNGIKKLGPFIFENNCQASPFWMIFILWGFFWICCALLIAAFFILKGEKSNNIYQKLTSKPLWLLPPILFALGTFLVTIPEFFYIKDIYPQHFRANTMFKLGYQAFIMMSVASGVTFYLLSLTGWLKKTLLGFVFLFFLFFVFIYPFFAFPSYYGKLDKAPELDGSLWLKNTYPQDKEIVDYINSHIIDHPVILEAPGDSYTDFERISAFTGTPTIAGWWVHEWLWRGSPSIVGDRLPDITAIYESADWLKTKELLNKYKVQYVVVSGKEREKYTGLNEGKFQKNAKKVFQSVNRNGALYRVN